MRQGSSGAQLSVVVTGGRGFIGQHLCRGLCNDGHHVHATSRQQAQGSDCGLIWHRADMADLAVARTVFAAVRPDVVFHLSGAVSASPNLALVLPTFQSLLTSTINVLLAAMEVGCRRIVLVGSLTEPVADVGPPIPQAPYAAAKWAASGYGRMFHSLYEAPVVLLRPFMTYGPGQAETKLIPSVTLALLRGERPRLSSGQYISDWVYISDVIDGFAAAATAPGIEGETIDLGSGTLVPIYDLVDRLAAIIGNGVKPLFGALPDRPRERVSAANTLVAADRLGWRATTSLDEGLRRTVDWYSAANSLAAVT